MEPNYNINQPYYNYHGIRPLAGWSWGGFAYNIVWGIANKVYLPLLALIPVPFLALVIAILCGVKGHEWAANSGAYRNQDAYEGAMESWNRVGFIMFIIAIIGVVVCFLLFFLGLSALS